MTDSRLAHYRNGGLVRAALALVADMETVQRTGSDEEIAGFASWLESADKAAKIVTDHRWTKEELSKRQAVLGGILQGLEAQDHLVAVMHGLVQRLIAHREECRKARQFKEADLVRDWLAGVGVEIEDGPDGARWRLVKEA